jgi:hypothetical protein
MGLESLTSTEDWLVTVRASRARILGQERAALALLCSSVSRRTVFPAQEVVMVLVGIGSTGFAPNIRPALSIAPPRRFRSDLNAELARTIGVFSLRVQ